MILDAIFNRSSSVAADRERRADYLLTRELVLGAYAGGDAALPVTPETAITNSTVFACVRILAETIAALPLITYERIVISGSADDDGRRRAKDFYLYSLLHDSPNEFMTSFEFRETVQGHLALWGNAYCQIDYDGAGRIVSLFPLRPDRIHFIEIKDGVKRFLYQLPSNELVWLPGLRIWHLRAFGDGVFGYSPIELMKGGIGLAMSLERYANKFFGNGARPGGILEYPGKLGPEAIERVRASWQETHGGLDNAQKVAILEEGLKWVDVGFPPGDSQFLEQRKFSVTDIARMYRIPPHMVADLEKATFSNIEHLGIEFVTHSLGPWLKRWEQSISKWLMTKDEQERYYSEFLVDGLLRGDTLSRYQAYQVGINSGWLTRADARARENLDPIDGLEAPLVPMNMAPIDDGELVEPDSGSESARRVDLGDPVVVSGLLGDDIERRARNQAAGRFRLARRQAGVFADAIRRILKREGQDVKAAARKKGPVSALESWLVDFYDEHAAWAARQISPAMQGYAEMVADRVADELDLDDLAGRTGPFVEAYAAEFGRRVSARSLTKLQILLKKPVESGDDLVAAIEAEVDGWLDLAPSMGQSEAVRENNAVALALYLQLGKERIMSVATGESDCPYCGDLDGKIIGINQYFLEEGQAFLPEGAGAALVVGQSMRHAPYHDGCDCMTISV